MAGAALGGYASTAKGIADAQGAIATTDTALKAATAARNAAQTLQTITNYVTPATSEPGKVVQTGGVSSGLMNVSTQARRIDLNLEAGHTYLAISVSSPDPLHPGWGIAIVDNNKIIYDDRAWIKH